MTSWEELRKILDKELVRLISAEQQKLKQSGPYPIAAVDIWKDTIPNYQQAIQAISELRSDRITGISTGSIPEFAINLSDKILNDADIQMDKSTAMFMQFCEATVQMYQEFTQQRVRLNDKASQFIIDRPTSISAYPSASHKQANSMLLSEVAEVYCKDMVAGGNWTQKTETEYRAAHKLLIDIIFDRPFASVDYDDARIFKETLLKLPSNKNKKPLYRGKSIKDVVAMQIPKEDLLSITKVNAYIGRIAELFKWSIPHGHTTLNPFSGIRVKQKKDMVPDNLKRVVFDESDLKALFTSPVFQAGKILHPHYYWLPLLGLYTGARLDELCQLHLDDIYQVGQLWVIDFNDSGDKKLKNQPSARIMPIHSRLVALGLVKFVAELKSKGADRLFPELKKGRDGYSQAASKWFARYRKSCGVTDDRKAFHSFRHTFDNFFKQRKTPKEIIAALMGHKDENMTTGLYGMPYEPSSLVIDIELLDFQIEVIGYYTK